VGHKAWSGVQGPCRHLRTTCTCPSTTEMYQLWRLEEATVSAQIQLPKLVPSLHLGCWHAANSKTCLIMKVHRSNCHACLSAAGNKAEFMHAVCAGVIMPHFNSCKLVPRNVSIPLSNCQKDMAVIFRVCFSSGLRRFAAIATGEPLVWELYGS
jgi:hypothetical protein